MRSMAKAGPRASPRGVPKALIRRVLANLIVKLNGPTIKKPVAGVAQNIR